MTDVSAATAASSQVTTAATSSVAAANLSAGQANLNVGYSTFLTLLTTQLKNQDPTSPLDTNQFTNQLVQMTGVQQQLLSNELLQTLVNQNGGSGGVSQAVGLIGKSVRATGDTTVLDGGQAAWSYDLPSTASSATLSVTNAAGRTVWTGPAADLGKGRHDFTWNGKDASGAQLADGGAYKLVVAAQDAAGKALSTTTELHGVVGSVETVNGSAVLNVGKSQIPFTNVTEVENASS